MGLKILIDEFDGDPAELYELVRAEVTKREVPGVSFSEEKESRSKGWFRKEKAPMLVAFAKEELLEAKVLAYQYGRAFHVSTRVFWIDEDLAEKERKGLLAYLEEVRSGAFAETVNRSVRAALTTHLEKRQKAVPPTLNPKDVFYTREAQTGRSE